MMPTHEEMVKSLNEEFESNLADMKPYVLQLQLKSERQRCALWIKKLCEPHQYSGLEGRRLRNLYCKALLTMLKTGVMDGPFLHRPPEGALPNFPPYLEKYVRGDSLADGDHVPDWVADLSYATNDQSELTSDGASDMAKPITASTTRVPYQLEEQLDSYQRPRSPNRRRSTKTVTFPSRNYKSSLDEITNRRLAAPASFQFSSDEDETDETDYDNGFKPRSRSPVAMGIMSPVHQRTSPSKAEKSPVRVSSPALIREHARQMERQYEKDVEMKVKVIEARMHEEKLQMQQQNDEEIQKILDRKNKEIDDVKAHYKQKLEVAEENIAKLEKRVNSVLKDAQIVRENKDLQIVELKKLVEESAQTKTNSLEKKIHDMKAEHELEKIEMQKSQTASIQALMDETTERLQKMEDDYRRQGQAMADTIRDLEKRIQVLTLEAEKVSMIKQDLEQQKIELEGRVEQLTIESSEYKLRCQSLEREHQKALEDHKHDVELMKEKHASQLNFARKEHQLTVTKNSDMMTSLEQQLSQAKQAVQEIDEQRKRQIRELEQSHGQDKLHLENLHDKKVRSLHREMEQQEGEYKKKMKNYEKQLCEREKDIEQLQGKLREEALQAEHSLQELRQQVERQQEKVFSEMKQQMQQVEDELDRSKKARLEQTNEFEQKVTEIRAAHENELRAIRQAFEEERQQLAINVDQVKDTLVANHGKEISCLKRNHEEERTQLEEMFRQRRDENDAKINEQAEVIHDLREELAQSENLRKQQLMEIGIIKDEETSRLKHEHERAIERLKSDCERQKHELQRQHAAELEGNIDKTDAKLKSIEKDYSERVSQQADQMANLQIQLDQVREEKHNLTDQLESRIVDNNNQYEAEKRFLKKQSASTIMKLQREIEGMKTKLRQTERNTQNLIADHEEDLVQLRLEHEEKMKGLMPVHTKEQLESTVASLQNQVMTLKQHVAVLQENSSQPHLKSLK